MSIAHVNGLSLHYEEHGTGDATPLVLLHGGLGAGEMFGPLLPALAEGRRVFAVDLQAHGGTADIDRPLGWEALADDVAGFIAHLGAERADVFGYSLGSGVALRLGLSHPERVRRLVLVSAPCRRDGWYPEVLAGMDALGPEAAEAMRPTPMYELYARVAPRTEDWPVLLTKVGELLRKPYDWSAEVAKLAAPTLLVFADADGISTTHITEFYGLLGGGLGDAGWDASERSPSRLAVLPGATHYDVLQAPGLVPATGAFLTAAI